MPDRETDDYLFGPADPGRLSGEELAAFWRAHLKKLRAGYAELIAQGRRGEAKIIEERMNATEDIMNLGLEMNRPPPAPPSESPPSPR